MPPPDLSNLRSFLSAHVQSYEQLEVVLLLQRRERESLTATETAEALRIPKDLAESALVHLEGHGLVVAEANKLGNHRYMYGPRSADLGQSLAELARVYNENRLAVVELMSANAVERLRTSAIRTFAECFRLGQPRKKDG